MGLILAVTGLAALYLSWKARSRNWPLVCSGWAMISLSILSWAQTSGVDKGPALGIVVLVLVSMLAVLGSALRMPVKIRRKAANRDTETKNGDGWRESLAATGKILSIILLGVVTSVAACTALFVVNKTLGLEHTANLTITMFVFPLIWAAFSVFIGYAGNLWRKGAVIAGLLGLSTAAVAVAI
ncbi:MAG: hypothetical protein AAGE37_00965 [Pseudomonadota bacterium]